MLRWTVLVVDEHEAVDRDTWNEARDNGLILVRELREGDVQYRNPKTGLILDDKEKVKDYIGLKAAWTIAGAGMLGTPE